MAEFGPALLRTLRHEGVELDKDGAPVPGRTGYVNNPRDRGKETNFGIVIAEARAAGYEGPMAELPFDLVKRLYLANYWVPIRGDEQPDQELAERLFDVAVNCGSRQAVRFLQRVLNVLNFGERRWPDLALDSRLGPVTLATLKQAIAYRADMLDSIRSGFAFLQGGLYIGIAERDSSQEEFEAGWLPRVGRVRW